MNKKEDAYCSAFSKHLKRIRIKIKKLTQNDVAFRAGIELSAYNRIERNHNSNITLSTLYALAKALEVSPSELLDFKVTKN
jgi:transcriptional regulator with XRE-family HTH domain